MRTIEEINKELSKLYKERDAITEKVYGNLIGKAYRINGVYFYAIKLDKNDVVVMQITDGDIKTEPYGIQHVKQWLPYEIPKEEFVSLLNETHEFQKQAIGEE